MDLAKKTIFEKQFLKYQDWIYLWEMWHKLGEKTLLQ